MFPCHSPRYLNPKPSPLLSQLSHILNSPTPPPLKIVLLQHLISHIQHKSTTLKIQNRLRVDPSVEEKELWGELEALEEGIIWKRKEKEDM